MESKGVDTWKKIIAEWNEEFPFLKPYGKIRLFYRTDIFLIGLWLDRIYDSDYRLTFEIKAMWEYLNSNDCNLLSRFVLSDPINKYSDYWLKFSEHDFYFQQASASAHRQYDNILHGKAYYDFLMTENEISYDHRNSCRYYSEVLYIEFQLATTLFFQDMDRWNESYRYLEERCRLWEKRLTKGKRVYGVSSLEEIINWRKRVEYFLTDRDKLLSICEENSKIKKIRRLNKGELIYTPYVKEEKNKLWSRIVSSVKKIFP